MGETEMKSEATRKYSETVRNIRQMAESLGEVRKYITLIHAFSGCDTTSALFGQGKISILRLLQKSAAARDAANTFANVNSTHDDVGEAGSKILALYGGKNSDTLSSLRYAKYMKMASGKVTPEKLPPTERAAYFHSLRTFLQVQEWNNLENDYLDATQWGWKVMDNTLVPVMTDDPPAADELLNVVRCNCKTTSKNVCGPRCSCRANGLKCVPACGGCRGVDCSNCELPNEHVVDDDGNVFENIFSA